MDGQIQVRPDSSVGGQIQVRPDFCTGAINSCEEFSQLCSLGIFEHVDGQCVAEGKQPGKLYGKCSVFVSV